MKTAILVLTYNNYADTRECLASLAGLEYPDCEVVVVDNGSCDGSLEKLRGDFPSLTFIENGTNLGYAGGNNRGIARALERGADAVWLLNNDTVVHPEALARLAEAAASLPDAGILGSFVCCYDAPQEVHFAGGKLVKGKGKGRHIGGEVRGPYPDRPQRTDFVTGASLLARREMIEEVGALDESFFLYLEDVDWALRARRAGWATYVVPGSRVWHKINRTTQMARPRIIYYVCRNSLYLCRRHFPLRLPQVLGWCLYSYVASYLVKWVLGGFDPGALAYLRMGWRGVGDFLAGRMGEYVDSMMGEKEGCI